MNAKSHQIEEIKNNMSREIKQSCMEKTRQLEKMGELFECKTQEVENLK